MKKEKKKEMKKKNMYYMERRRRLGAQKFVFGFGLKLHVPYSGPINVNCFNTSRLKDSKLKMQKNGADESV